MAAVVYSLYGGGGCRAGVITEDELLILEDEPDPYPPSVKFTGHVQH
jgi:hypothetical protein